MLKSDRIGLVVVVACSSAIAAIIYLLFHYQTEHRLTDIRSQGIHLVRTLAAVPYQQLLPGGEQHGIMQVLKYGAAADDFAYASIVNPQGRTENEVTAPGLIIPSSEMPLEPALWLGEKQLQLVPESTQIIEFHAPLLENGDLMGFVRLGYHYPEASISMSELPFLAAVALPVFLLVPLFYFLLRLEIRPVRAANKELCQFMEGESFRKLEVTATGELGDFMHRFNKFIEMADSRIQGLEHDQERLITSSKLLTYRKNRIETVLETLPEAVLILDESGQITFANQKLGAMFDVSPEVIIAQPIQEWCDRSDVLTLLAKYQTNGLGHNYNDTFRFNLDAARDRAIATKTYPLFTPGDASSAIGTLIIFRDETQEALAKQARTDFVSHLSHELKSPLNVLGMYSETLLSDAGKNEEFRIEAANVIAEEVSRLSSLINGLLNMTQIESGSLTPDRGLVKLRDVASAAFEEAQRMAKDKDYVFEFDVPKELNPIFVDKDLIRIALTNLLSNAVKYNNPGGKIRLTVEETEDAVQIRVADSGIGISEQDGIKIFDKFFRSEDSKVQSISGHGLGLALTKQIIELHQGSLTLDRDRQEGTEFIINLWKETTAVKQAI